MEWLSRSQLVIGKALTGEIDAQAIDVDTVHPAFTELLILIQAGATNDEIVDKGHFTTWSECNEAAEETKGFNIDWVRQLESCAARVLAGNIISPLARRLERGEQVSVSRIRSAIDRLEHSRREFTKLDKVEPVDTIWKPTFWKPWDDAFYGLPDASMTLIGAPPKCGKTSLLGRMLMNCAKKGKKVAFFSLEMPLRMIMYRFFEIEPKLSAKSRSRIIAADAQGVDVWGADEIYAASVRLKGQYPDLYMIGIDFADMMIEGEEKTAKASHIYRVISRLAGKLEIPVVLLCQLSEKYVGTIPQPHHIRWSRLAEAFAAQVMMLFNPDQVWIENGNKRGNNYQPQRKPQGGYAWVIQGMCRFKMKNAYPGYIEVPWDGQTGWGNTGKWNRIGGG